jgi:type I restriction enzyme, R subunit
LQGRDLQGSTVRLFLSHSGTDFQEVVSSQLPALHLLVNLGYSYLTPVQALEARGGKRSLPVLTNVLEASLRRLNRISYRGKTLEFSPENIRKGVDAITNLAFESHQKTAQDAFDLLTLGTSLEQVTDGDQKSFRCVTSIGSTQRTTSITSRAFRSSG